MDATELAEHLMETYPYYKRAANCVINLLTKDIVKGKDYIQFGVFDKRCVFHGHVGFSMRTQRDADNFPDEFLLALKNRDQKLPSLIEDKKI